MFKNVSFINSKVNFNEWDYVGNRILNPILKKNPGFSYQIDRIAINALPELREYPSEPPRDAYTSYYFADNYSAEEVLESSNGLIYLHNSWTSEKYRKMSANEFLNDKNTMSNLFKTLLSPDETANID